ncbi:MAG: hypothetical protein MZV63_06565 [Marinilabiliales bacterium]|nr:hypothetical protein [Marinilabiliales bacterium]
MASSAARSATAAHHTERKLAPGPRRSRRPRRRREGRHAPRQPRSTPSRPARPPTAYHAAQDDDRWCSCAMCGGRALSRVAGPVSSRLPAYIGAMIVAAVIRNVRRVHQRIKIEQRVVDDTRHHRAVALPRDGADVAQALGAARPGRAPCWPSAVGAGGDDGGASPTS